MSVAATATTSEELTAKVAIARPLLTRAASRLFDAPPGVISQIYPEYLRAMHNVVVATVPLIDSARTRLTEADWSRDPLVAPLADYLSAHRDDEVGHDEMVLADLAALGLQRTFVTDRAPWPEAVDLVGAQYYFVNHVHPVMLLGHIFVLESAPVTSEHVDVLIDRSGLPAAAFRSLRLHSTLDADHAVALRSLLDRLALTASQRAVLGQNALCSVARAAALLERVAGFRDPLDDSERRG